VLTPSYVGLANALDLPQAATFCNQCSVVCPVKIPLPDLMRKLRETQWVEHLRPWYERLGISAWSFAAKRPAVYALMTKLAVRLLKLSGGRDQRIRSMPLGSGWTASRDFPVPAGKTFRELYRRRRR
jgi:L-lactate dehydrogenase complex protein LldF